MTREVRVEARFKVGDAVQRINAADMIGVVMSVRLQPQIGAYFYDVAIGAKVISVPEENLRAFRAASTPWDEITSGAVAGARSFRMSLTHSRVTRPPSRIAKSFSSARTQFYPHQFKPLLKLLHSPQRRILIGDDVGLGKTIEAGYILTELEAGRRMDHVMIVVPARLRLKWQSELEKRFGQRFELVTGGDIRRNLGEGRSPPSFRWIASYEGLRSQLENLKNSSLTIDCLVFDEAHRLRTPSSQQHKVGAILCERSDAVVMLSATPIQTSLGDLFNLAKLLLPAEFGDRATFDDQMADNRVLLSALDAMRTALGGADERQSARRHLDAFLESRSGRAFATSPVVARACALLDSGAIDRQELTELQSALGALSPLSHFFTRTRKVDAIPRTPVREAQWLSIELEGVEKQIYDTVVACCRAKARGSDWAAEQSMTMVYRAVASCIPAAMRQFKDELHRLMAPALEEPLDEESPANSSGELAEDLRAAVRRAVMLFEQLGAVDSKFETLCRGIEGLWASDKERDAKRRKVIVFSYFRGTVEYLADALTRRGIKCRRVHGGIATADREGIVDSFLTDPSVDVLVTSDVSAEGVDLQVASVIFNYDLPWNPMVVEQRIGRIDRIGQEAKVLTIANLVVKDSIEERILKRLFERVHIFETAIGELDGILGGSESVEALTKRALLGTLEPDEIEDQIRRAEEAYANQRSAAAALDARAGELLAVDQALLDEIRAATGEHQIPTESQLLEFVNSALAADGSGVVIPAEALSSWARVELRKALAVRGFDAMPGDADRATQFMRWAQQDSVAVTFSREVAYRFPNVELIHATHPLARWASKGLPAESHAFCVALERSSVLGAGAHLFALSFLESPGGRSALRVAGVASRIDDGQVIVNDSRALARLVGELLRDAVDEKPPWGSGEAPEHVRAALGHSRAALDGLVHEQNVREREMHDLRETARAERSIAGYRVALERAEALMRRYRGEGAQPFVVRMQEAKVDRARERMESFERAPGTIAWADPERYDVAVGLLLVRN